MASGVRPVCRPAVADGGFEMTDEALKQHIRQARGKFTAMVGTYALGVFNDNFFKQAAILLAISAGLGWLRGLAAALFAVPYVLFASYAGWMADRFSKRKVIIGAKVWELAAMLCGAAGLCTGSWVLIMTMVFMMGFQSAVFGPALNGSIPELYPPSYVTTANAIAKGVTTAAILMGIVAAGYALNPKGTGPCGVPVGRLTVAAVAVSVSVLGVLASFAVLRRPAAAPQAPFPRSGPVDTFKEFARIRRDPLLAKIVWADVFIWFVGSLQLLIAAKMGMDQLGLGEAMTSNLMFAELIGIAIGGAIGARLAVGPRWHRVLAPSALAIALIGMAAPLIAVLPQGYRVPVAMALLGLTGVAGGIFMIPCESFIQIRPAPEKKGAVIAASNCAIFLGIMVSGVHVVLLDKVLIPTTFMAAGCAVGLPVSIWLWRTLPGKVEAP